MFKSNLPSIIVAGTTVEWVDKATTAGRNESITSPDWTMEYYLRTNVYNQAHTATATQFNNSTGFEFTISADVSKNFSAGDWYYAARVFKGSKVFEIATGQLTVKQSLQYSGTPNGLDNRTQTEKDLESVEAAIRAMVADKAQEYSIGNRTFKRIDLDKLRDLRAELKSRVATEKRYSVISQGLGDPKTLYVRF